MYKNKLTNNKTGWIKLPRAIKALPIYPHRKFTDYEAFIDLLLSVNHTKRKILFNDKLLTVNRGQLITSQSKLAGRWTWTRNKVRSFLEKYQELGVLSVKSSNRFTRITICDYEAYQGELPGYHQNHQQNNPPNKLGSNDLEYV